MLFPALKITFRAERRYEMAYVTVPKDLTKIKSKVMFNLTKRQLICFSAAVAIGLPLLAADDHSKGLSLNGDAPAVELLKGVPVGVTGAEDLLAAGHRVGPLRSGDGDTAQSTVPDV